MERNASTASGSNRDAKANKRGARTVTSAPGVSFEGVGRDWEAPHRMGNTFSSPHRLHFEAATLIDTGHQEVAPDLERNGLRLHRKPLNGMQCRVCDEVLNHFGRDQIVFSIAF